MMGLSVSVGPRYEKLIVYLIQIGRFRNKSEVVRLALQLLEQREFELGYVHREEEFQVLMGVYARFHDIEREKEYPSKGSRHKTIEDVSDDIIDEAREVVEKRLDHFAKTYANS